MTGLDHLGPDGATLTLRSANGVIKTENYPPGAKVTRIKKPAGGAA